MGEMNESQKAVMNLLSKEPKPDVGHAETLLDLAKATKLPPRVLGQIETYIKAGNEAGRLASEAKEAQKSASNVWDGVRDAASRTDDLVDLANEAAEEEGDEEDEGDKGEAPAAEQTKPARTWAKGTIVKQLSEYLAESALFKAALADASLEEIDEALAIIAKVYKTAKDLEPEDARAFVAMSDRIQALGGKMLTKFRDLDAQARKLVLDGKVAKIVEEAQAKPAGTIPATEPATTAATTTTPADPKADPLAGLKGLDRAKEQGRIAFNKLGTEGTTENPYDKANYRAAWDKGFAEAEEAYQAGSDAQEEGFGEDTNPYTVLKEPALVQAWKDGWSEAAELARENAEGDDDDDTDKSEEAGD